MKKLTRTMKCAVMLLSLCLLLSISTVVEAAKYQPNVTYVNPTVNSKDEYYSVTKMRMETYSDTTFEVVYPKDATIEVSTNKSKKLQAMITNRTNESPYPNTTKKVYITPTKIHYDYYHWVARPTAPAGTVLEYDDDKEKYYYDSTAYNPQTQKEEAVRIYVAPDTEYYKANVYFEEATGRYYYWSDDIYIIKTYKNFYNELLTSISSLKIYLDGNPDVSEFDYAEGTDANGITRYAYRKDSNGYYAMVYDSDFTTYPSVYCETFDDGTRYEYATATIQLTSTKKGTYKVNVIVNGVKTTLKVYVTPYGNEVFTKVKLGEETINSVKITSSAKNYSVERVTNYKVKSSLKSAKLKLTANKGIKITGIVVASINEDGNIVMKKYKNGKNIKLSQGYAYNYNNAWSDGSKGKSAKKYTYVCVSYTDKYTKRSVKYSIVKKHGKKQIKEVSKGTDGKKRVSYYDYGEAGFALWSY